MDRSTKRKIKNQQKKKKANLLASEDVPVSKPEKKPEDFEERESDSNEDEFCPECNNYVGKKGSFISILLPNFTVNFILLRDLF